MASQTDQANEWSIKRLLDWTDQYLDDAEIEEPRLSAEILLAHVLDCQRIDLYVKFDQLPTDQQKAQYKQLIQRCIKQEPVAYLTGKASFYNFQLHVSPDVLIPRPETEGLVVTGLDFLKELNRPSRVLDLCSGSGCISLALAKNNQECNITAADISPGAIAIAQKNIELLDLNNRITLTESNLFESISDSPPFDLIVSNPPYVCEPDYETLDSNVRDYEPKLALVAGEDGLDIIRMILSQAEPYLAKGGGLMMEIGYNQADTVTQLMESSGYLSQIETQLDFQGHRRIVQARKD